MRREEYLLIPHEIIKILILCTYSIEFTNPTLPAVIVLVCENNMNYEAIFSQKTSKKNYYYNKLTKE